MDFYRNFVEIVDDSNSEQVYALCPFHPDRVPSFTINVNTHQWYCHGCGEGGGYVSFLQKFLDVDKQTAMNLVNNWQETDKFPFPSPQVVEEAHRCLKGNVFAMQLISSWGVTDKLIDRLRIGYSNADKRFYFPVYTKTGFLVNIRKYMPAELRGENKSIPKVVGIQGCNESRFWPVANLSKESVFIVEGEKDALCAISQGLNAVTGTGGSNIPATDYSIFKGKKVYIMTDNDDTGDSIAQKYIDIISAQTNEIKRIRLPVKDFTDYFLKYGDANVLQYSSAANYSLSRNSELKRMSLVENESVDNMQSRVLLDNMIVIGNDPKTYAIPCVISLRCDSSGDCKRPCKLFGGKTTIEHEFEDRDLIHMIDSSDKKMYDLAAKVCNCKMVTVIPTKYTNAQRIVFQEKASLLGGISESSYEPRYGFYMYDKERLVPTAKYVFDATKVTDPRTQKIYYSIKNAKVDLDEFKDPVDFDYFRDIYKQHSSSVIDFLNYHYQQWLADCRVYGRLDLFSALLLTMCSVTEIPYKSGSIKGVLDTIAIGDTRTGKSLMAQNILIKMGVGGYINGENAKLTGVLGGVVRLGDSWIITWGAIPLNDKGFVVIDEATGLSVEDITQMSSVRSSCVATINKVVRGEARARTRLFWIANPRSGKNVNEYFWKGFGAFQEFIPVNEDQARFDLIVGASRDDIDTLQDIKSSVLPKEIIAKYRNLINWAWNIDVKDIKTVDYAHLHIVSDSLCRQFKGGTLLIKEAAYEKILRIAAALSVLTGSVVDNRLVLSNEMLDWAGDYLAHLFTRPAIDYAYYVAKVQEEERLMKQNTEYAIALCSQYPALRVLLNNTKFRGTQMAEVLGLDRDEVSKLLSQMLLKGLIKMTTGGLYTPSVSLINIIRKLNGGESDG
jgi:5S rRNA maturation endonuclease (ribonuclease M5)